MNEVRARAADRMAEEMLGYLIDNVLPGVDLSDPVWRAMDGPDRALMQAIGAYERGEISFEALEAAGVEYVEAWGRIEGRGARQAG